MRLAPLLSRPFLCAAEFNERHALPFVCGETQR
jgi:hypothetical protein